MSFPGDRVDRRDSRYPTMVRGFNHRFAGDPRYVQVCGDPAQVVKTVQRAVDESMRVTVRSGGHCYEDFVCDNHDGVIIDLSPMNDVYREGPDELYCVEGGATLWDVYVALYKRYGVTIPGGSCYAVGAGGHVTGGGYGLLSRLYGLTIDHLHAVELVHVDRDGKAHLTKVSRDSSGKDERELLWAHLGGGGGNFGIVTKFWFADLPRAPAEASLLNQAWNWSDLDGDSFSGLLRRYGNFFAENSAVGSPFAGLFALLHLSQNAGPGSQIALTAQYVGDDPSLLDEFANAIAGEMPPPTVQTAPLGHQSAMLPTTEIQSMQWLFATQQLNGMGAPRRGKYKSAYMIEPFPERQIEEAWQHLSAPLHPNPLALLQVDSYGCQVNAVAPDATASPQRSSIMKLQYQTYWDFPADDARNLDWIRNFYEDMYGPRGPYPDGTMDGCYVNYPDVDLADWEYLYYKESYPRLQQVKARWDPGDVFHHQQSIRLRT
jgi:FAD/FMN-containing dehydrogenase